MKLLNIINLNTDGKIIFKNFSYLSLLRVFNILSQYIIVSFLVRTLGSETYGVFVWAFSIIQYLVIIVNFGFNTYAAKYITDKRNNQDELNKIFSAILGIKLSFLLITVLLFLLSLYFIPALRDNGALLIILLGFALGEALFPIWFFQGKEKLGTPTKIVFIFKFLLILLTVLLITSSQDILKYAILLSSSQFLIGLAGLVTALTKFDTKLIRVPLNYLGKTIKEGFIFFIGSLFSKTFNLAVIFLAGIYFTMDDVTSFDISFKIIAAFQIPFETLSMVLFPTISRSKDVH